MHLEDKEQKTMALLQEGLLYKWVLKELPVCQQIIESPFSNKAGSRSI